MPYGSDPLAYDFDASLAAAKNDHDPYWDGLLAAVRDGGFSEALAYARPKPPKPTLGQVSTFLTTDLTTEQIVKLGLPVAVQEVALAAEAGEPVRGYWQVEPPDREGLHQHVRKFGPDGVKETAATFGINMQVTAARSKSGKPRQRRTTDTVRAQVLNLHARGLISAAIADTLNLSDRRVKAILTEATQAA